MVRLGGFLIAVALPLALAPLARADEPAPAEAHRWQHGLSYFGTFKYPPDFEHLDNVNPDAPVGGRLVAATGTFDNFTPFIAKGIGAPGVLVVGQMTLYDSLLWSSDDEVGVFYGNLAEKIAVSDDATQVRMRLREEAHWHDGVPITARDIKFSFEHIKATAFSGLKAAYASIKQIDIVDAREVLFTYHYPVNLNTMMALGKVAMLPEHYWRDRDSSKTTIEPPLSSGPYRVGRFELGQFIEFERVPDYWGYAIGLHRGRHNIEVLRYDVYRDATVTREALRKGVLDFYYEPSASQWVTGYDLGERKAGLLVQDYHNLQQYVGVSSALAFNLTQERFQDVRVREALSLAFDLDWMNRVLNYDAYQKPGSYFHGTFLAATGLPSATELEILEPYRAELPERVFTEPPFGASSLAQLTNRERLIRARALLGEAGWSFQDGKLVDDAGNAFEIEFLIAEGGGKRNLLPYVGQLARLGIDGRIRLVETAQYINRRRNNESDAVFGSLAVSFPPSQELPAYLDSGSFGVANFARLSAPIVDDLVEKILAARTRADLAAACHALDRVLFWEFYFIPVRVLEPYRVVFWNKFGQPEIEGQYRAGFPDTWWWDEAKAARVSAMLGHDQAR